MYHLPSQDVSEVFLMFVQLSISGTGCVYLIHAHTRAHKRTHAHPWESTYLSLSLSLRNRYANVRESWLVPPSLRQHSCVYVQSTHTIWLTPVATELINLTVSHPLASFLANDHSITEPTSWLCYRYSCITLSVFVQM